MAIKPTKHKQTIISGIFLKRRTSPLKKTCPIRFEPKTFAVPGKIVTSRPSVPELQRKWNSLLTEPKITISNFDHSVNKVIYGKKSSNRLQYHCLSQS